MPQVLLYPQIFGPDPVPDCHLMPIHFPKEIDQLQIEIDLTVIREILFSVRCSVPPASCTIIAYASSSSKHSL